MNRFAPLLHLVLLSGGCLCAQTAPDSPPPPRLTVHARPKPLSPKAVTADWPRFLGPSDDATTPETQLLDSFPPTGPVLLWELEKEDGFACPAIAGGRLLHFQNIAGQDLVECRDAETGTLFWSQSYPNRFRDRYGYGKGPRAAPVIAAGRVYTLSATSLLHAFDLESGRVLWKRDLGADYAPGPFFFGHGPSPLVLDQMLILPIGGKGVAVAAFDAATGNTLWECRHEWTSGYASPLVANIDGKKRLLIFTGNDSEPPAGGLLCLNPATGAIDDAYPWRSTKYESVNASTPAILPGHRVLISETYTEGAALLRIGETFQLDALWKAPDLKLHWMTPLHLDGHLYAFTGRNEPDAGLDCWDAATGARKWREEFFWKKEIGGRSFGWSFFRGTLLHADGRVYALGELGTLAILDLSPKGGRIVCQADLFSAPQTWILPALSRGLLYVAQNQQDLITGKSPRLLCYDFRKDPAGGSE